MKRRQGEFLGMWKAASSDSRSKFVFMQRGERYISCYPLLGSKMRCTIHAQAKSWWPRQAQLYRTFRLEQSLLSLRPRSLLMRITVEIVKCIEWFEKQQPL